MVSAFYNPVATPVDTIVNPLNTAQRYILWGNGRIDALGGAPAATAVTYLPVGNSGIATMSQYQPVLTAIWITDWSSGQGYALDRWGGFYPINGAAAITTASGSTYINSNGLAYSVGYLYVDWAWNPSVSGQGYALTSFGEIRQFGGASAPPRTGPRWPNSPARKLAMSFSPSLKALTLDCHGGIWPDFGGSITLALNPYWSGWDAARDIVVMDWTTTPNKGYVLDLYGGTTSFGGQSAAFGNPYQTGGDHARTLSVINASNPVEFLQVWAGGQQFDYFSSTAPTVACGNGTAEVQTVTITGTPTGGTFTLSFGGNTTAATAFSATAATVQTNLRALASIGAGNVTVTGGPGPGTPYVVTFTGALDQTNVAQMTASSSFTGGSSPTTTVTTTIDGITASPASTVTTTTRPTLSWSYNDAQKDSQAFWEVYLFTQAYVTAHSGIDANPALFASGALAYGNDVTPGIRGVVAQIDLANGAYKYYVRVRDSSGLYSTWANRAWTQSVTAPSAPTSLTVTADQTNLKVGLSCNASGASFIQFQYSDDGGTTWNAVRGADAVPLLATTTATDYDVPLGSTRLYRAFSYSSSPRVASAVSGTGSTLITRRTYAFTSTSDPTLGGEMNVIEAPSWSRPVVAGVFEGIGAVYPVVVSDGTPKARKFSVVLDANSLADWQLIENLVLSNSTLVMRTPFGGVHYFRVVGDWTREQQRRGPLATESTSLRHAHHTTLPCIEIAAPATTTFLSTVPPGPAG